MIMNGDESGKINVVLLLQKADYSSERVMNKNPNDQL